MNSGKLDEETLTDIRGGLNYDTSLAMGRDSKFREVREMADAESIKLDDEKKIDPSEITEEEFDKMAYDYYHGDEDAYRRK